MKPPAIPPGARFFEKGDGLPVLWTEGAGYVSVPTGVNLFSLDDLIEISRREFDELVEAWPPPWRVPLPTKP